MSRNTSSRMMKFSTNHERRVLVGNGGSYRASGITTVLTIEHTDSVELGSVDVSVYRVARGDWRCDVRIGHTFLLDGSDQHDTLNDAIAAVRCAINAGFTNHVSDLGWCITTPMMLSRAVRIVRGELAPRSERERREARERVEDAIALGHLDGSRFAA